MRQAFTAAARLPRLEFIEERWPGLAAALSEAGLDATSRMKVMVATNRPDSAVAVERISARQVVHLDGSAADDVLERYLDAAHAAFEQPLAPAARRREVALLASALTLGHCRISVIVNRAGEILAGAGLIGITLLPIRGGEPVPIAELAAVWTAAAQRGRGLASLVAAAMVDRFAASGGIAWLGAEGERSAALYGRLGFRAIGHQQNFCDRALEAAVGVQQAQVGT
jgi:ribosomal protein S18 acetylase RimI-like enzyme